MSPTELAEYLSGLIEHRIKISTMLWGPPGVGKSSIVAQTARKYEIGFIDVRLSQLAPTDLRGLPVPQDGVSKWYPPEFLPREGEGILFLEPSDRNLNCLIEISTHRGKTPVMVQEFLPAVVQGDKRIILLEGQPIGAVNRIPSAGELRGNMAAGGTVAQVDLTQRDYEICQAIAPALQRDGLYFVGIDVIGGYLTEVNVTSPTGIREIDRLQGVSLGDRIMDWLESKCTALSV